VTPHDRLKEWLRQEYDRRTRALEQGAGRIEWVMPECRVSFSEVVEKARELSIKDNITELRNQAREIQR